MPITYRADATLDKGAWSEQGTGTTGLTSGKPLLADDFAMSLDSNATTYAAVVLEVGKSNTFQVKMEPDSAPSPGNYTVDVRFKGRAEPQGGTLGKMDAFCHGNFRVEVVAFGYSVFMDAKDVAEDGDWHDVNMTSGQISLTQEQFNNLIVRVTGTAVEKNFRLSVNDLSATLTETYRGR